MYVERNCKRLIGTMLIVLWVMAMPPSIGAHGTVEFPMSRVLVCYTQGGFYGDGSNIPNDACREAFKLGGEALFTNWNAIWRNVSRYNDQAAVEAAIPDGHLCAAGNSTKAGLDVVSGAWPKQPVPLENGTFRMAYLVAAHHYPSFVKIYLSKPGYSAASRALRWSDLDLIYEGKAPPTTERIGGKQYYFFNVRVPAGRTGPAVLYTRWQREDPVGEGFYACSDVVLEGAGVEIPWYEKDIYVAPGTTPKPGDTVRFRVMGHQRSGSELVDERLAVTAANASTGIWAEELATAVNSKHAAYAAIGVLDGDRVHYDATHYERNMMYVKNDGDLPVLSILPKDEEGGGGSCESVPAWEATKIYDKAGIQVSHVGKIYASAHWTQNQPPDRNSGAGKPWTLVQDCEGGGSNPTPIPPTVVINGPAAANAGDAVLLDASASTSSNPDASPLQYTWKVPTGIDAQVDGARLHFTAPSVPAATPYAFEATVADGHASASKAHTVTVQAPSSPEPVAIAKAVVSHANDGAGRVVLSGEDSHDPAGGPLQYAWTQTVGTPRASFISSSSHVNTEAEIRGVGQDTSYTFRLTVTNSHHVSSSNDVTVMVKGSGGGSGGPGEGGGECAFTDPDAGQQPMWDAGKSYAANEKVQYNNVIWQAGWASKGTSPDKTDAFSLLSKIPVPWERRSYAGGAQVIHGGRIYQSQYWANPGDVPGTSATWKDTGRICP